MTVKTLVTVVKMVYVWIFRLLSFQQNSVSATLGGLEKIALDVRKFCSFLIVTYMLRYFLCAGSSLSDAVIRPEDYSIHRQLSPRLSLYARLVTENVSVYVFSHALVNSHHHNSIGTTRTGSCSKA